MRLQTIFIKIVVIFAKIFLLIMEGFITFIFITIVGFYALGLIGRLLLKYWVRKKQREFSQQFGQNPNAGGFYKQYTWGASRASGNDTQQKTKEGEVKIEQTASAKPKKVSKDVGDYVDYEEIK